MHCRLNTLDTNRISTTVTVYYEFYTHTNYNDHTFMPTGRDHTNTIKITLRDFLKLNIQRFL